MVGSFNYILKYCDEKQDELGRKRINKTLRSTFILYLNIFAYFFNSLLVKLASECLIFKKLSDRLIWAYVNR